MKTRIAGLFGMAVLFFANPSPTPEPATLAMIGVALVFTARRLRRER